MKQKVDCLLIGHNEMNFVDYEKAVRQMGVKSGAYRDLNMNFIRYNNNPYTLPEIFNIYYLQENSANEKKPFHVAESFSAAIAYLGTYLHKRGFTIDYVNSFRHSRDELIAKITGQDILSIVIVTTLYVSVLPVLEIVKFIRSYNQAIKIIIGGPFVSTMVRNLEKEELNHLLHNTIAADIYVNSSQGEAALVKVLHALKNNLPLDGIDNIYYKTTTGLRSTPVSRENNKLSENMVDWNLFSQNAGEYVNVRTTISCPFSCSFCGFPQHAGKYQTAAVEEIEAELQQLHKIKSVQSVHFIDDTFNIPVERFKKILKMIKKSRFRFKWHSYFRCQFTDRETVALMKDCGCEGVFLGIESGNDQILKNMNKAAKTRDYLKGIELLKEYGIVTFGCFITGFPGETEKTVRDTVDFIEKSGLDFYRTQLWYCEPITPIYREREAYGIKGNNFEWSHATMDTTTASDIIEEVFAAVKNSTWIPQYNFDFDSLWHLRQRGMDIDKIKEFLESFNLAIAEKLTNPGIKEVSYDCLEKIRRACSNDDSVQQPAGAIADIAVENYENEFDF